MPQIILKTGLKSSCSAMYMSNVHVLKATNFQFSFFTVLLNEHETLWSYCFYQSFVLCKMPQINVISPFPFKFCHFFAVLLNEHETRSMCFWCFYLRYNPVVCKGHSELACLLHIFNPVFIAS